VLFAFDGEYLMPQDLEVEERFRGQGIAQTMYDYVKSKGYKIRRSGQQTDAGAGFWDKHKGQGQHVWEQGVAEGDDYDSEWDEKVKRLGQMAKEGPRKTVWDPVKRVYKTVPINAPQDKKPSDQNIAENWEDAMTRAVLKLIESQLK
jgi:hypothetical protein